ncbi:hypothetical protein NEOKW01_0200 [Nematocida sp. AWRm80]|nr:hypothetical protein NEOKW01_0200 [Nematocida sp. AWRm80]
MRIILLFLPFIYLRIVIIDDLSKEPVSVQSIKSVGKKNPIKDSLSEIRNTLKDLRNKELELENRINKLSVNQCRCKNNPKSNKVWSNPVNIPMYKLIAIQ